MPDNYDEEDTTITYADLVDFEQGYADAMLGHFSNRDDAERWIGIDGESLATETLEAIRNDCRRFVINMIESSVDEHGSMELEEELYDYEAGRYFFLERMEVGIGFTDMAREVEVRQRLVNAGADFTPFELDIGDDRLVRIVIGPLSYRSLNQVQQGFADALVELVSESQQDRDWEDFDDSDGGEPEGRWDGVTVHDFSERSLRTIVEDCEKFVVAVFGNGRDERDDLHPDIPDYDIGWNLYMERQGAGVGMRDLLPKGDLLSRVLKASDELGEMTVEVGDDGQIHIHNHRGRAATPAA